MQPVFISVAELCVMLSIGRTKANELIGGAALIQSTKMGRRRLIVLESAQAFASQLIVRGTV